MKLQEELGREATDEELADELDMTAARVRQMRMAAIRPASLDAPIGDDDSNNFSDVVEDENATSPYGNLEDKTVTDMLQDMVKHLDKREATILRYRFGLDGGTEKTLEEVGVKFGVTRERVRQIQNLALRKLRKMIEKLESTKEKGRLTHASNHRRDPEGNRTRHPQRPGFPETRNPVQGHHARAGRRAAVRRLD